MTMEKIKRRRDVLLAAVDSLDVLEEGVRVRDETIHFLLDVLDDMQDCCGCLSLDGSHHAEGVRAVAKAVGHTWRH